MLPAEAAPSLTEIDAAARAKGNAREDAVAIARALLARKWASQVVEVRVDRVDAHRVAGVTLLGVKFKRRVDAPQFLKEANELVDIALNADHAVEEVDLRATIPAKRNHVGEFDQPLDETVFTLTVRRDAPGLRTAYWDPGWRAQLGASSAEPANVR